MRQHYAVRIFEHYGNSLATGKKYMFNPNNSNNTAILNHINLLSCIGKEDNFQIIGSAIKVTNYFVLGKCYLFIKTSRT